MVDFNSLFADYQNAMLANLRMIRYNVEHSGTKGAATEDDWKTFFQEYLPARYKVDDAIVVDSDGNTSDQIDVVIYDSFYTPFILNHQGVKYIPAEGVYAVFEVKPDLEGHIDYAADKIASVRSLKRTSMSMVASGITYPPRQISKIIGGILTTSCHIKQQDTIINHLKDLKGLRTIDLGCCVDYGSFYVDYEDDILANPPKGTTLSQEENMRRYLEFYEKRKVRTIKFSEQSTSLFTFFLQLTHYLKTIGTVPAIDINAYLRNISQEIDIDF